MPLSDVPHVITVHPHELRGEPVIMSGQYFTRTILLCLIREFSILSLRFSGGNHTCKCKPLNLYFQKIGL